MNYDALVVGGGPAGATAALLLARAGWSVAVVERKSFPRRKVCGEFISATTEPLLRELGVGEIFAAQAGPAVRRVGLFAGDTELSADMPQPSGAARGDRSWGRALGREHLDLLLLESAQRAGATVWQPWTAVSIERGALGHACAIAHKGVERALFGRVVIAAQGSWEKAPWGNTAAPTPDTPTRKRSDLLGFKAHLRDCDLPDDLMPLLVFPGGYGGMVRSDGGRVSLSCCVRRDALRDIRRRHDGANAGDAMLAHIQDSCGGVRAAARRARLEDPWLSAGPIRPGIRPRYREGLFYVGNTAGEAHPVIAEGISMAMQSAAMLCARLTTDPHGLGSDRTIDGIGAAYAADWKRAFSTRIHAAAAFAHLTMRPRAAALWVPVLRQFPKILTWSAALSGKATEMAVAS